MGFVKENLADVHEKIRKACSLSGRDEDEVTLICVSKTKPIELMLEAYEAGERVFGENKVQEILKKKPLMPDDAEFHLIGHLQTNKVRQIVGNVSLIHSVDSIRLAQAIGKESVAKKIVSDILIEVNVAMEESKFGISFDEVEPFVEKCSKIDGIRIRGLMCIAPFVDFGDKNRIFFNKLKQLCVDLKAKNIDNTSMDILSMGMTGDYEAAIAEGATMVRVGTGIFGAREYNI